MNRPLPGDERLARQRARKAAWWAANPDYRAQYTQANLGKIRERNRDRMRAATAEKQRRKREIERVTAWAKQNPDKKRAARERYKQRHPEQVRASQREYYHRNKDAITSSAASPTPGYHPAACTARSPRSDAGTWPRLTGSSPGPGPAASSPDSPPAATCSPASFTDGRGTPP